MPQHTQAERLRAERAARNAKRAQAAQSPLVKILEKRIPATVAELKALQGAVKGTGGANTAKKQAAMRERIKTMRARLAAAKARS